MCNIDKSYKLPLLYFVANFWRKKNESHWSWEWPKINTNQYFKLKWNTNRKSGPTLFYPKMSRLPQKFTITRTMYAYIRFISTLDVRKKKFHEEKNNRFVNVLIMFGIIFEISSIRRFLCPQSDSTVFSALCA